MPILKFASGAYLNFDALEREIQHYVFPKAIAKGGGAVDPEYAVQQMKMVKELWGQTDGKQLHHFVLIFSDWESQHIDNIEVLIDIGYHVCLLFSNDYQCVFGVHDNGRYHIHFVLNSVNYRTGEKFTHNKVDDELLANYIATCCIPYQLRRKFHLGKINIYYN